MNLYQYARSRATRLTDPSGNDTTRIFDFHDSSLPGGDGSKQGILTVTVSGENLCDMDTNGTIKVHLHYDSATVGSPDQGGSWPAWPDPRP